MTLAVKVVWCRGSTQDSDSWNESSILSTTIFWFYSEENYFNYFYTRIASLMIYSWTLVTIVDALIDCCIHGLDQFIRSVAYLVVGCRR